MKLRISMTLAVLSMAAAWANEPVVSLHALVTEKGAEALEPGLVGNWEFDVKIVADGKGYRVKLDKEWCTLRLMKFNGLLLGDLRSPSEFGLAIHAFMILRVEGDELHVRFLGTKWLEERIKEVGWPRFEALDGQEPGILLTASSAELHWALLVYFWDDRALDEELTLKRRPDDPESADKKQ